jgi:predicted flavoprotein YhiN
VLDISRYFIDARLDDPAARLFANWLPGSTVESLDTALRGVAPGRLLAGRLPERLARALVDAAGVAWATPAHRLTREARRSLARTVAELPLPIAGDRGFNFAEVTAGGVPLAELDLDTMRSRRCPGLSLCGEMCDVDGRIGGFNFQWAWASGYVAGVSAGRTPSDR